MITFSFFKNTHYSFDGKKEGEEVHIFLHRHWYTLVSKIAYIVMAGFIPFIVVIAAGSLIIKYNMMGLFAFLWAAYYLFLWYMLFYVLTMYSLDAWIVTNLRVIDSRQHGFFNRTVAELSLGNIQDVSFTIEGAVPTMMNYGDVQIQTAANEKHFLFMQIPNPQFVKDKIMHLAGEFKSKQRENPSVGM
ncbi:MAG: hypothetical protein RL094_69 [Candidatus Parcubacteria bacterium]|jgi:hypothetical protein